MCTANEGLVRIQYKCLVPIYVFPEMKLCSLVISKTELWYSVSQFPHSCICERWCIPNFYKLLTDTWMYELGMRARRSISGNTKIGFRYSVLQNKLRSIPDFNESTYWIRKAWFPSCRLIATTIKWIFHFIIPFSWPVMLRPVGILKHEVRK